MNKLWERSERSIEGNPPKGPPRTNHPSKELRCEQRAQEAAELEVSTDLG